MLHVDLQGDTSIFTYSLGQLCISLLRTHSPATAAPSDALTPDLAARMAPVMAPLPIEFHGSSLSRIEMSMQSNVEYRPPHTPKLPEAVRVGVHATLSLSVPGT